MAYARIASGYQVGGPNFDIQGGGPPTYKPSTTVNYELGLKGEFYDHKLTVDISTYYIDWRDIQITVLPPSGDQYIINGGHAKSEGFEYSLQARPLEGLHVSVSGSYGEAELTRGLPADSSAYANAGAQLPYYNRFSGTVAADEDIARFGSATSFVGAQVTYVGLRYGEFASSAIGSRYEFPAYAVTNVHGGFRQDS